MTFKNTYINCASLAVVGIVVWVVVRQLRDSTKTRTLAQMPLNSSGASRGRVQNYLVACLEVEQAGLGYIAYRLLVSSLWGNLKALDD